MSATGTAKTPKVQKLPNEEEFSSGTCADFDLFLKECKARTLLDDATQLDKIHPSIIHQSITSSAWVPNTPILAYFA